MNYSNESNSRKKSKRNMHSKKIKNKVGVIIFRIIIAAILITGFGLCGAVAGAYLGIIDKAPKLAEVMKTTAEKYTTIIYDEHGNELERLDSGEHREFVSIEEIPKILQHAFVAIEDERYYDHNGTDLKGMVRAVFVALTSDRTQGASTITQQLIKNKLKITRNSIITKLQEQYLAVQYEKNMTEAYGGSKEAAKDKILELYLNSIGLGYGQIGVQAAAMRYFSKTVSELTLAECAVIAAITQNPSWRDPIRHPEDNQERQIAVLKKMLELEFITKEQYDEAIVEDVYSKVNANQQKIEEEASYYSYFTDQLIQDVIKGLQNQYAYTAAEASDAIYYGGLKIYSTINTEMQKIVDETFLDESVFPAEYALEVRYLLSVKNTTTGVTTHYEKVKVVKNNEEADAYVEEVKDSILGADDEYVEKVFKIPQPQAGMAIIDYHTGKVMAIAGGRGEKQTNRGLNRATGAKRSPGSVFKILASFAPALDLGKITAATVIDDIPFEVGNYAPNNWYSNPSFRGLSTIRDGVRDSMNIVAVKNMYNTGVDNCFNYLLNFGLSVVDDDRNLSAALGGITYGVSQDELAAAYGAIANGGVYYEPIYFTQVLDHDNNVLLENIPQPKQVLKKTTAYILTDMMKDVITPAGTGSAAAFKNLKMPIAGKTGTTSEDKDLVFAGYTPYYAASIYLGYDTPKSMDKETKRYHMQIWSHIMEQIHVKFNLEYKEFEIPEGIVYADICSESGKLAVEGVCTNDMRGSRVKRNEVFARGTEPTEYCDVHMLVERVDMTTGYAANAYCPEESVQKIVGIIRPEPYMGDQNVGDKQYELNPSLRHGIVCPVHTFFTKFPDGIDPDALPPEPTPPPDNGFDFGNGFDYGFEQNNGNENETGGFDDPWGYNVPDIKIPETSTAPTDDYYIGGYDTDSDSTPPPDNQSPYNNNENNNSDNTGSNSNSNSPPDSTQQTTPPGSGNTGVVGSGGSEQSTVVIPAPPDEPDGKPIVIDGE